MEGLKELRASKYIYNKFFDFIEFALDLEPTDQKIKDIKADQHGVAFISPKGKTVARYSIQTKKLKVYEPTYKNSFYIRMFKKFIKSTTYGSALKTVKRLVR